MIEIKIESVDQVTIVELAGELDSASTPMVAEQVMPLAEQRPKILLDMQDVTYMSSAGLRMLLLLHREISGRSGQVALIGLGEEVKDTMSVTGFLEFFKTYENRAAGLKALTQD